MEPIFSIARQQPSGLKNGTQEKENNKETGGVFPIEGTGIIGTAFCSPTIVTNDDAWLLDLRATDQMTFTNTDFSSFISPRQKPLQMQMGSYLLTKLPKK